MSSMTAEKAKAPGDFDDLRVAHRNQKDAMAELLFQIDHGRGFELINLVGPSGVGKTTLKDRLTTVLLDREKSAMASDPDYVPLISTTALASGYRSFDWKVFYQQPLISLGDPFVDVRKPDRDSWLRQRKSIGESITASGLRIALENELRIHGARYWIVDEAHHILLGAKAGSSGDQFDVLKSIAQTTKVKLILIGTYDLTSYVESSAQLARRTVTVHLGRYLPSIAEDRRAFTSCAATFMKKLPVAGYPDVTTNLDFYFGGSAGCVGLLKDWCGRALSRLQMDAREVLTLDDFRKTRLRRQAMQQIMEDILKGEELLLPGGDDDLTEMVLNSSTGSLPARSRPPKRRVAEKPGNRSPSRDTVPAVLGGVEEVHHA